MKLFMLEILERESSLEGCENADRLIAICRA